MRDDEVDIPPSTSTPLLKEHQEEEEESNHYVTDRNSIRKSNNNNSNHHSNSSKKGNGIEHPLKIKVFDSSSWVVSALFFFFGFLLCAVISSLLSPQYAADLGRPFTSYLTRNTSASASQISLTESSKSYSRAFNSRGNAAFIPSKPPSVPLNPALPYNLHRFVRFIDRLHRGLPVVIGVLGGSISVGWGGMPPESSYGYRFVEWLNVRFPINQTAAEEEALAEEAINKATGNTNVCQSSSPAFVVATTVTRPDRPPGFNWTHTVANRASPGMNSAPPSVCYRALFSCSGSDTNGFYDMQYHDPDLMFVEFSVNDHFAEKVNEYEDGLLLPINNIERMVRQILGNSAYTAVFFLYMTTNFRLGLVNMQEEHQKVADHYHIPSISLKDYLSENLYDSKFINLPREIYGRHELRPVPRTPLPPNKEQGIAMLLREGNVDFNKVAWSDDVHTNAVGHEFITQLVMQQLERYLSNYLTSGKTSIEDPLTRSPLFSPTSNPQLLSRPPFPLTSSLHPDLQSASTTDFICRALYGPFNRLASQMNDAEAMEFMGVDTNVSHKDWVYAVDKKKADKWGLMIHQDHTQEIGQQLVLHLTPEAKSSLFITYLRTREETGWESECDAYLSCDNTYLAPFNTPAEHFDYFLDSGNKQQTLRFTPRVRLKALWTGQSSQAVLKMIWPLSDGALKVLFGRDLTELEKNKLKSRINCPLAYLHLEHMVAGQFKFIGVSRN